MVKISYSAGDVAIAGFEEQRNSLLLCLPSVKECICKRVNYFTSGQAAVTDSAEENGEHEDWIIIIFISITICEHKLSCCYMIYCIVWVLDLKHAGLGGVLKLLTIKLNDMCVLEVITQFWTATK